MWATGGPPLGPTHWPPIVARRRELLAQLGEWTPPPALGAMPEAVNDPMPMMLWGVTPQRLQEWAQRRGGRRRRLIGAAASPGVAEGRARVVNDADELGRVRDGEILVCTITSPAWAPIFPKVDGGRHRHRRRHVARRDRLPRVRPAGRRRHRPRDGGDRDRAAAPRRRLDRRRRRSSTRRLRELTAPARRSAPRGRGPLRRQERRRSASCSRPGSRCRAASAIVDRCLPRVRRGGRPRGPIARRSRASTSTTSAARRGRVRSDQRGDALRAAARTPSGPRWRDRYAELAADGGRARPAGRGALERARRGQRGGHVRRPAGDLPLGARRRSASARPCATAGRACYSPPCDHATGRALGDARASPRWASPCSTWSTPRSSGVMFTLQPRQRRPERGGDQRQLGARPRRRRRRGDAGRVPGQQGHGRGRPAHDQRQARRVPPDAGRARAPCGSTCLPDRRDAPCLDDAQLAALVAVARDVEHHFGAPPGHRVGDRRGRRRSCYVLQTRPVTDAAASTRRRPARRRCRS